MTDVFWHIATDLAAIVITGIVIVAFWWMVTELPIW